MEEYYEEPWRALYEPYLSLNIWYMLARYGGVKVIPMAQELKAKTFKFVIHQGCTRGEASSFV
jgi:hypothetical protein